VRVSLAQQIDEVQRELRARRDVYARLVASGKMRQSIADFQMQRLEAVLKTLEWFQRNEDKIRAAIGHDEAT